jgi:hypothetical protein
MSDIELTCPSGLRGMVRGLKGRDFRNFNRQTSRSGEGLTKVLQGCWTQTIDPGPYAAASDGGVNWADVLIGDRLYALIGIRQAMYPEEKYSFRITCREMRCRQSIDWQIDLLKELPVKKLPEASKAALVEGRNEFKVDLAPPGVGVWFKLMTGRDQSAQQRMIQQAVKQAPRGEKPSDLVLSLASRIIRVEGLDGSEDFDARVEWLEDLDGSCHRKLLRGFDAVDCGVETSIEVECQACMAVQGVELPFDETFLMPR